MKPSNSYKEVQKLTRCLAALNRFISKSGERNLPFFKNLRNMSKESPALPRRLTTWAIKLRKFEISYVLRTSVRAQALADFITECTARAPPVIQGPKTEASSQIKPKWTLVVDGARNDQGAGAGVLILGPREKTMEYALRFSFLATNNEVEYEAMILGLWLVKSMGVEELFVKGDSKLLIDQIRGYCGVKNETLMRYHTKAVQVSQKFKRIIFEHIPRAENEKADRLSRLATTYYNELLGVYVEFCDQPAYKEEVIRNIMNSNTMDWRDPIIKYLNEGMLPSDSIEAKKIQNRSFKYQMYQGELYRKS
ncbi:hypothetical protein LIER_38620 [Lithospermum erythrorhizon]|uniref:RNase H type-1 domain-containing protein n=1 Tax=Lithospermum erythrorhizon TaxID=34254 RepID=A0AAV3Q4J9_LITER